MRRETHLVLWKWGVAVYLAAVLTSMVLSWLVRW